MNDQYETLELRRDKDLLWLILNRPASLNAMNSFPVNELHADQSVRGVIIRGAGQAFCAGLDLRETSAGAMEDRNQILTTRTNDVRGGIAVFLERRDPHYEDA